MILPYKILEKVVMLALLAQADPNFKVIDAVSGSDAQSPISGVHLAQDIKSWSEMWMAIQGDAVTAVSAGQGAATAVPAMPRVDFDKNVIVGIFGGVTPNVQGYEVIGATGDTPKAQVQVRPVFRPDNVSTVAHNPYLVLILPRTRKEVEIQMLVPSRGRPQFQTIATLPRTVKEEKETEKTE